MAIRRLLIANRGEIARRVQRTCRSMGIATVAVYSDPDATAAFVREADEAVPLGGATAAESYLRGDAIIDAARRTDADAVHPGYGFLSENAAFAGACIAAGLTWVGPPPLAIETMGSKVAARRCMVDAGVPVVPGVEVPEGGDWAGAAAGVGYPVLVKASAGGGGRGMRIVAEPAGLADAIAAARREAASAFGDDTIYLERYLERARHIEIQVMADGHGHVVALFERECSIQRRHQKVIEEAPSPFVSDRLRRAMGDAAVAAAIAVGYTGAGTVEFIVDAGGQFYFLEMNTRLQVEHPVTEMITGLDLVRLQLLVAGGEPLPAAARSPAIGGHAIEARLYAEDPAADYVPSIGRLERIRFPSGDGIRVDSGFDDGDTVSPHYDSLLSKVVVHAPTRQEAIRRLAFTLTRAQLHGVLTNRDLLVNVLESSPFVEGDFDTEFLQRHPELAHDRPSIGDAQLAACAAALAASAAARAGSPVLQQIEPGWRNAPSQLHRRTYDSRHGEFAVGYALGRRAAFEVNGEPLALEVVSSDEERVVLVSGGVRRTFSVHLVGDTAYVDTARGSIMLVERPRFPSIGGRLAAGSLVAPMPGTVVSVEVSEGDRVVGGQLLAVIEAMKMEHQITTPVAGVVKQVNVAVKDAVQAGAVLVVVEPDTSGDAE